jgi:hypothetical protein
VWLKIVSVLFALFGIAIALLNQTSLFQMAFSNQINPSFWGDAEIIAETLSFQQWVYGLLGATCLLVGIVIFFVVKYAFAKKERWASNCLLFGLGAWFVIDTPISFYFHVYFNVIFNAVLLLAGILPVLLTRKVFQHEEYDSEK